jgi:hypothetical protein
VNACGEPLGSSEAVSLLSGELQLAVHERHKIEWHWFILWESSLVWGNADK